MAQLTTPTPYLIIALMPTLHLTLVVMPVPTTNPHTNAATIAGVTSTIYANANAKAYALPMADSNVSTNIAYFSTPRAPHTPLLLVPVHGIEQDQDEKSRSRKTSLSMEVSWRPPVGPAEKKSPRTFGRTVRRKMSLAVGRLCRAALRLNGHKPTPPTTPGSLIATTTTTTTTATATTTATTATTATTTTTCRSACPRPPPLRDVCVPALPSSILTCYYAMPFPTASPTPSRPHSHTPGAYLAMHQHIPAIREMLHYPPHLPVRTHTVHEREAGDLRFLGQPKERGRARNTRRQAHAHAGRTRSARERCTRGSTQNQQQQKTPRGA